MRLNRSLYRMLLLIMVTFAAAACSGTRSSVSTGRERSPDMVDSGYNMGAAENTNQSNVMVNPNRNQPSNIPLDEQLARLPGVRIQSGRGLNARFVVDGTSNSFMSDTSPLFVVNGSAVGTDFSYVYTLVDPREVVSISVLKGSDASLYGTRGANGVILIRTRPLE